MLHVDFYVHEARSHSRKQNTLKNFYCCTVHSEIYTVHSPTNALFIKLGFVLNFTLFM
jgi:hypothetical protein